MSHWLSVAMIVISVAMAAVSIKQVIVMRRLSDAISTLPAGQWTQTYQVPGSGETPKRSPSLLWMF